MTLCRDTPISWSLPFKAMARSLPLWALFITSFCSSYFITSMIMSLPILIDNMFDSDIRNNGFLSTLPSLAALIFLIIGSLIADFITSRNILTPVLLRKTLTFLGMLPGSTLFIAVPYVSNYIAISFIMFSFGMCILNHVSLQVNLVEVASRYSSFLSGILAFFGMVATLIVPSITGFLISQSQELSTHQLLLQQLSSNGQQTAKWGGLKNFSLFIEARPSNTYQKWF
ncbi:probable small intestine urate exporter [Dromiciops gliroides]|uniref:probable small intestine urate exporter n=1 Tax=Dromiciops gliroides TaxID=33562 RepID=UPI001CC7F549|nr:probable small intestine urate exporter [Dromiciops gliroides]